MTKFINYLYEGDNIGKLRKNSETLKNAIDYIRWHYPKENQTQVKDFGQMMRIGWITPYSSSFDFDEELIKNFDKYVALAGSILDTMVKNAYGKEEYAKKYASDLKKTNWSDFKKFLESKGNMRNAFAKDIDIWIKQLKVPEGFQSKVSKDQDVLAYSISVEKMHPFTQIEIRINGNYSSKDLGYSLDGFYALPDRPGVQFQLGQRGISDYDYGRIKNGSPSINDVLKKGLDAVEEWRSKLAKAVRVKIGATTFNFTDIEARKKELWSKGSLRIVPSGMGLGYNLYTKPVKDYGVRMLDKEAMEIFGGNNAKPIWFSSFEYD